MDLDGSGIQCYRTCGYVLYRSCNWYQCAELRLITGAVVGALLGFLLFNVYPASVFMGDTGSLALRRICGIHGIYAADAVIYHYCRTDLSGSRLLSVIIQVTYFKKTGGKTNLSSMAPIHHHFELGGWSETRVVAVFSIVTALLCHGCADRLCSPHD